MSAQTQAGKALIITWDGSAAVNVQKLLKSERMQAMIKAMREKTEIVPRRRAGSSLPLRHAKRG